MGRLEVAHKSRPRVVIVDDSKTMQAVLDQILSLRLGCDVVGIASDAASADALIRNLRPDLVTIDLLMPYIDGRKLLEMLADLPDVRKVIISGQISKNLAVSAKLREAGADACIDKYDISGDPTAFCAKIRAVLAKGKAAARTNVRQSEPVVHELPRITPRHRFPVPLDEQARLNALRNSGLANDALDTRLDLLTAHLAAITDFPTCLMTFIDRDHQWVKSAYGFARGSMPRAIAFCNYTLCQEEPFMVPNAPADARFAHNPLVTDQPRIRSYFGSPIVTGSGINLGAICLIDTKPRRITPEAVNALRSISQIATQLIEGHHPGLAHAA